MTKKEELSTFPRTFKKCDNYCYCKQQLQPRLPVQSTRVRSLVCYGSKKISEQSNVEKMSFVTDVWLAPGFNTKSYLSASRMLAVYPIGLHERN